MRKIFVMNFTVSGDMVGDEPPSNQPLLMYSRIGDRLTSSRARALKGASVSRWIIEAEIQSFARGTSRKVDGKHFVVICGLNILPKSGSQPVMTVAK